MDNQNKNITVNTTNRSESEDKTERVVENQSRATETDSQVLPAGEWARQVLGFDAPFGHDGMPTVWG